MCFVDLDIAYIVGVFHDIGIQNCAIEKFTNYIFDTLKSKDIKRLFELLGYDILDSSY